MGNSHKKNTPFNDKKHTNTPVRPKWNPKQILTRTDRRLRPTHTVNPTETELSYNKRHTIQLDTDQKFYVDVWSDDYEHDSDEINESPKYIIPSYKRHSLATASDEKRREYAESLPNTIPSSPIVLMTPEVVEAITGINYYPHRVSQVKKKLVFGPDDPEYDPQLDIIPITPIKRL